MCGIIAAMGLCIFRCVAVATHFLILEKEGHSVKYNGIEIERYKDEYLIKQLGLAKGCIKLVLAVLAIGFAFCLFSFVDDVREYGFSAAFEYALPMIAFLAFMCILFGIPALVLNRYKKAFREELDKRAMQTGNKTYADETRKTSRYFLVIVVLSIAIFVVVLISALSGKSGGSGSTTCPNCGTSYRSDHSAADFIRDNGYCGNCRGR